MLYNKWDFTTKSLFNAALLDLNGNLFKYFIIFDFNILIVQNTIEIWHNFKN